LSYEIKEPKKSLTKMNLTHEEALSQKAKVEEELSAF